MFLQLVLVLAKLELLSTLIRSSLWHL